jgi:hypothetical protein
MSEYKSAWITGASLIIAAFVFGLFFYTSKLPERTIRVVGYATQEFEADIVKWSFNFSIPVPLTGLNSGYRQMKKKLDTFKRIWDTKNISSDEFQIRPVSSNPIDFAEADLAFEYSRIEYFSSKLEDIKKQLLSGATRNARERAEEIVSMTESGKIGKMSSARAGVFQITEPLSTDIAGYGIHSTATRKKSIKVTVNAVFSID